MRWPENIHVYNQAMEPIHAQVLEAACALAGGEWTFRVADVARALPHLNPGTVRTHVASRCCVNAPAHHQSRYSYFRALRRGVYRIEPSVRRQSRQVRRRRASQDIILSSVDSGVDRTLLAASMAMTPTERIETMRRAAMSLDRMCPR
jgi:hypothetical protein